jgi:hypothetical protein
MVLIASGMELFFDRQLAVKKNGNVQLVPKGFAEKLNLWQI